jgi:outer membrane protein assembly factor BamB
MPLGPSYSGPIVAADRVFVTETVDEAYESVRALDRRTGETLWAVRWPGAMKVPFFAKANGDWIRATPAYDGERLYVAGMRDVLVCLNGETGEEVWRKDFVAELGTPLPKFGFASSPLVVGDSVYVQAGAGVIKLDKLTGNVLWRSLEDGGGMNGSAFSSPTVAQLHGIDQLLVQARTKLAGIKMDSGEILWSLEIPAFRGMNILTPTVVGNTVFTSSYGGRSMLLRLEQQGAGFTAEQAWNNKLQGYMSSPVVIAGHIYVHLKNQRFACVELATGDVKWTSKPFGKYWSMVAAGDRILALDERGELLLIRATPEQFDLVDRRQVSSDSTWAHLAVAGRQLFVRELNALAAYLWQGK